MRAPTVLFLIAAAAQFALAAEESPRAASLAAGFGYAFPQQQNGRGVQGN